MDDVILLGQNLQFMYQTYAPIIWTVAFGYLLIVNYAAFLLFKYDKARAIAELWRIPEATLLGTAFWGGSIGAKVAQRRFRHKTRKEPFRSTLNTICVLQVCAILTCLIWYLGYMPGIAAWIAAILDWLR